MKRLRLLAILFLVGMLFVSVQAGQAASSYIDKVLGIAPENLLLYLPLNEVSGSTARDHSPNGLDAQYISVTLAGKIGPGGYGNAPSFDGINDYISLNLSFASITNYRDHGTVSFWMSPGTFTTSSYPFLFATEDASYWLYIAQFDNTIVLARDGSGVVTTLTTIPATAGWVHIAGTWIMGGDMMLYVNGIQSGTPYHSVPGASLSNLSTTKQNIGAYTTVPYGPFLGSIAHFTMWNMPLSESQIASLADPNGLAATSTPPPTPNLYKLSTLTSGQMSAELFTVTTGETSIIHLEGIQVGLLFFMIFILLLIARRIKS